MTKELFLILWYHKLMFPDPDFSWDKFNNDFEMIYDFPREGLLELNEQNLNDEIEQAYKRYLNKKLAEAYIEGLKEGAKFYYIKPTSNDTNI